MKNTAGFTLIELLVVSGILVAVSGIIGGILFSTLRGTETTRSKTLVAQNGNYAITSMSEIIKRARNITGVYTGTPPSESFTDCTSSPEGTHMSLQMPEGQEVILTCNYDDRNVIASTSASTGVTYNLTNDALVTTPGSCKFACYQSSQFSSPRVEIQFTLGRLNGDGDIVPNTEESFHTQINIRNFNSQ